MARAPIQRLADRVAAYFVPAVVLIATGPAQVGTCLGILPFNYALLAFVSVIIIACPCALGLATPAAILVGTAKGAQNGILIKGGESLETAHKLQAVVFDKTGTLTHGKPSVTDIVPPTTIPLSKCFKLQLSLKEDLSILSAAQFYKPPTKKASQFQSLQLVQSNTWTRRNDRI